MLGFNILVDFYYIINKYLNEIVKIMLDCRGLCIKSGLLNAGIGFEFYGGKHFCEIYVLKVTSFWEGLKGSSCIYYINKDCKT